MSLALHISALFAVVEGFPTRGQAGPGLYGEDGLNNDAYSFDEFARDYGRTYEVGGAEYTRRAAVFQDSLSQIRAINSRAERSWTAGVYPFMDWTGVERAERLHGYRPSGVRRPSEVALQTSTERAVHERTYGGDDDSFEAEVPEVRNQGGMCGSCWAHTAVEAVEAQLMKRTSPWPRRQLGEPPRLSVQALVDCVPNPKHCGGTGGCGGATPELAFETVRTVGLPTEAELPYNPSETAAQCPMEPYPSDWVRVSLAGWRVLPRNQAQPLMHALVKDGPVAVAADARDWFPYHEGVYDRCKKDAIPNHSVLARGYGIRHGKKYWILQNSWGAEWGEGGSIRLLRHDDEDAWCGVDRAPQVGVGCAGDAGTNVTVCGSCGLLYDAVVPQVDRVVVGGYVYSSGGGEATVQSLEAAATAADATMPMLRGSQIDKYAAAAEDVTPAPPTTGSTTTAPPATTTSTEPARVQALVARRSRVWERPERDLYAYNSENIASDFIRSVSEAVAPLTAVPVTQAPEGADLAASASEPLPEASDLRRLETQSLARDLSRTSIFRRDLGGSSGEPPLSLVKTTDALSEGAPSDDGGAGDLARAAAEDLPGAGRREPEADVGGLASDDADAVDAAAVSAGAASLLVAWPSADTAAYSSELRLATPPQASPSAESEAPFRPRSSALGSPMSLYMRR